MNQANQNKNAIWQDRDRAVVAFEGSLNIPNGRLDNVPMVAFSNEENLSEIPEEGGCYWIWTSEPVHHQMHRNETPATFDGGEVIYNGLTKDSIRWRVRNHLFSKMEEGWSGISMDIYGPASPSHKKRAMLLNPGRRKVAYYGDQKITSKETLLQLHLSEAERQYILDTDSDVFYFRNGINMMEPKHRQYSFRVYFIVGLHSATYLDFIEKKWRSEYGLPKLCTYSAGR